MLHHSSPQQRRSKPPQPCPFPTRAIFSSIKLKAKSLSDILFEFFIILGVAFKTSLPCLWLQEQRQFRNIAGILLLTFAAVIQVDIQMAKVRGMMPTSMCPADSTSSTVMAAAFK